MNTSTAKRAAISWQIRDYKENPSYLFVLVNINDGAKADGEAGNSGDGQVDDPIKEFRRKIRENSMKKDWAFWNTQPVPKMEEVTIDRVGFSGLYHLGL